MHLPCSPTKQSNRDEDNDIVRPRSPAASKVAQKERTQQEKGRYWLCKPPKEQNIRR